MDIKTAFYLMGLRERHVRDREDLRRALAGRRPQALKAIERRQLAVERETARILETRNGRTA
jgi:hypothetical protein